MGINLQKGQRTELVQQKFSVGLSWDANDSDTGTDFDLDASAFGLGSNGKLINENYLVFYKNLKTTDGAIEHTGDNQTGAGDGDDEVINIDIGKLNSAVQEIRVVVTIHEAESRKQNFGQVSNSVIRVFNPVTNEEILKYELGEDFSIETGIEFGRFYKKDAGWKFEAVGKGISGGLKAFVDKWA